MAQWIWQHLKPRLPGLSKIVIQEMQLSGCGIVGIESGSCFFLMWQLLAAIGQIQ